MEFKYSTPWFQKQKCRSGKTFHPFTQTLIPLYPCHHCGEYFCCSCIKERTLCDKCIEQLSEKFVDECRVCKAHGIDQKIGLCEKCADEKLQAMLSCYYLEEEKKKKKYLEYVTVLEYMKDHHLMHCLDCEKSFESAQKIPMSKSFEYKFGPVQGRGYCSEYCKCHKERHFMGE